MGVDFYAYERLTYLGPMLDAKSKAYHPLTGKPLGMSRQRSWSCKMRALVHPKTGKRLNVHRLVLVPCINPDKMYLYSGRELWIPAGRHSYYSEWCSWLESLVAAFPLAGGQEANSEPPQNEPFCEFHHCAFIDHLACVRLSREFRYFGDVLQELPMTQDDKEAGFRDLYWGLYRAVEFAKNGGGIRCSF
jgi:hypothetical protein